MNQERILSPAKQKRLKKLYGPCPKGYTNQEIEQFLDLFYGLFSAVYTHAELRHLYVSDPFDRSVHPRCFTVVELAEWLEALLA